MQVEDQVDYQLTDQEEAVYKLFVTAIQLDGCRPAKCKDRIKFENGTLVQEN
jgi:hypothetical protein